MINKQNKTHSSGSFDEQDKVLLVLQTEQQKEFDYVLATAQA